MIEPQSGLVIRYSYSKAFVLRIREAAIAAIKDRRHHAVGRR